MMAASGFSYALARLHARLAARMDEPGWQQLEASLDFAHALERAGRTPVARVTRQLNRTSGLHTIEAGLRQALMDDTAEIAAWLPPKWRAVAMWFALLPDLRRKEVAASDTAEPDWLPEGREGWQNARAAWLDEWQRRRRSARGGAALEAGLAPLLSRFLGAGDEEAAVSPRHPSWNDLETHFLKVFRKGGNGPEAVFAYLGLVLLDSERLRGTLMGQAVFARGS